MEQQSLFGNRAGQDMPLATRMRPRTLEEFAGQRHLLGKGKVLRQLIEEDRVSSMIFWGPPGVGKTTLAQIIAARTKANFINFSAVDVYKRQLHDRAYALLYRVLKDEWGIASPVVEKTPLGKPYLKGENMPHISLSHTKGIVCCAVSRKNVGIDAEYPRRVRGSAAERVLSLIHIYSSFKTRYKSA